MGPSSNSFYLVFKGGVLGKVLGEDLTRTFIRFPGVSFQSHGFYRLVGARIGGSLVNRGDSEVSHSLTWSGFAAFLDLELKHN